eukprot:jgi/Psemu1/21653/gm1.21653_g
MVVLSKQEKKQLLWSLIAKAEQEHQARTKQEYRELIVYHQQEIARHRQEIRILAQTIPIIPNGTIIDPPSGHPVVTNVTINPPSSLLIKNENDSDFGSGSDSDEPPRRRGSELELELYYFPSESELLRD